MSVTGSPGYFGCRRYNPMNEFITKYSKAGIWISLIGSSVFLLPLFYIFWIQLKAIFSQNMTIFWQKPDWSYVHLIFIGVILWLLFPAIYFISIRGCQNYDQVRILYTLSGITNITLILLPIVLFILIKIKG